MILKTTMLLEPSFSGNLDDPGQVIRDLKTMIQAYHDAGIGVIMDVVYNHTFSTVDAPFQTTVPDYYYRMNPDGTFQNGTGGEMKPQANTKCTAST